MKKQTKFGLGLLLTAIVLGTLVYCLLYNNDNKYTASLPWGYGYNVIEKEPDQVAFIVDGWEFYPGQLLEPGDFSNGISPEFYTYIGEFPNFSFHLDSPYGVATYRIILQNRSQLQELALYLPELLCAGRVYINGTLAGEQGSVDPYQPRVMDGIYTIPACEYIEIIIQCANYTHYYSGLYYPPAVGTLNAIMRMLIVRLVVYGFLCFSTLAIALFHLAQWLTSRDKLTRWMGLLSLAFALRISYPFLRMLGVPSVRPLYALEDVCGNIVLLCAILLAGELSGRGTSWYHKFVSRPLAVGICAFSFFFPLLILPYAPFFINTYGLILFAWELIAGLYLIFLARCILYSDRSLGALLLFAAGIYGVAVVLSSLTANRFEPICGAWLEEYGGFALVIGFGALMVRRGILLSQENQRLTFHLQEEVERKTKGIETLLKERRELLANLLHDLKNPLAALRGYADLVKAGNVAMDSETAGYLEALTERVQVLGERFNVLQDFSRGERGVLPSENICLNSFLKAFYDSNRPDMELSGLQFCLQLPAKACMVSGNPERLQIALENLCYNALSFTPPEGVITLSLEEKGNFAQISVQDTGSGIAPEDLPHVFERGFTRRRNGGGDGLGLFMVWTIALEHGGTVEVSSQMGKGTIFTLHLPKRDAE